MHCHRCDNMMFPIALQDWGGGLSQQDGPAWRCFACGEIVDQLIRENRNRSRESEGEWKGSRARHRLNAIALAR